MNKKLIILGSSGYGRTVCDIAEQLSHSTVVLDDSDKEYPLASFSLYLKDDTEFILDFVNSEFRLQWMEKTEDAGEKLIILIHRKHMCLQKHRFLRDVLSCQERS